MIAPTNWEEMQNLKRLGAGDFVYSTELWAKIVSDFAIAFGLQLYDRSKLLEALIPLYHSCILSFVNKTSEMNTHETENNLENFSRVFETEKPYLVKNWDLSMRKDILGRANSTE